MGKIADWSFKILAALVIPVVLWGIKLEVTMAVQASTIERLEKKAETTETNKNTLIRMDEKLIAVNKNLDEIKVLLAK